MFAQWQFIFTLWNYLSHHNTAWSCLLDQACMFLLQGVLQILHVVVGIFWRLNWWTPFSPPHPLIRSHIHSFFLLFVICIFTQQTLMNPYQGRTNQTLFPWGLRLLERDTQVNTSVKCWILREKSGQFSRRVAPYFSEIILSPGLGDSDQNRKIPMKIGSCGFCCYVFPSELQSDN